MPLQSLTIDENLELRGFLQASGYTTDALIQCFGRTDNPKAHLLKLALVSRTLPVTRLNTLFRWFWVDDAVDASAVYETIPDTIFSLFLKSGMVVEKDGRFVSTARISMFNGLFILSDQVVSRTGALDANTVLWPNPTSMLCHQLTIQAPVGRMLDFGTGNGIIGLAAAAHSGHVIGTDLNARARQFCEFNARLNGIDNFEFREGNAFEPVKGEHFDLIVANPPFFVTPKVRRVYCDNNMELDGFCRMLVRQAPEYLVENGYCQMMVEWVQLKGQPWQERIAEWVSGIGCDTWVITSYMQSSADYTMVRADEDREVLDDAEAQKSLLNSWLEYFEDRQVEAIYGGIIMLRRRSGSNWLRIEEVSAQPSRPFGDFLKTRFETRDALEQSDEVLLEMRPKLRETVRLEKGFTIAPEGWQLTSYDLLLIEGIPSRLAIQPQVGDFLGSCTGKLTLKQLAGQLSAGMKVDPSIVQRECCTIIRRLADRGMIVFRPTSSVEHNE